QGVLPACRTLDVVSIFALTASDAARVLAVIEGPDGGPVFNTPVLQPAWLSEPLRVAVPALPQCDARIGYERAFEAAVAQLESLGAHVTRIDMTRFFEVA